MAMKYAEAVLAVRYREQDDQGGHSGGLCTTSAMAWGLVMRCWAALCSVWEHGRLRAGQYGSIELRAQVLGDQFHIHWALTGVVLMLIVGAVILGGIQRIAATASAVVPPWQSLMSNERDCDRFEY